MSVDEYIKEDDGVCQVLLKNHRSQKSWQIFQVLKNTANV